MDSEFSFRKRFEVYRVGASLPFDQPSIELAREGRAVIELRSWQRKPIRESTDLAIWGSGFANRVDAHDAGVRWTSVVQRGLAGLNVPASFGVRNPHSPGLAPVVAHEVSSKMQQALGVTPPVAMFTDLWELMVFPSLPTPVFVGGGEANLIQTPQTPVAMAAFRASGSVAQDPVNEIAFDLLGASARIAHIPDVRLVLLVMTLECLVTSGRRSQASCDHLDKLVKLTREAPDLSTDEREVLANALGTLKSEPFPSAVQRLLEGVDPTTYHFDPAKVVQRARSMRNDLVHGRRPPRLDHVRQVGAQLSQLVADLIAGDTAVREVNDARLAYVSPVAGGERDGEVDDCDVELRDHH